MLTDKHFIDWESSTFGYGYGTGEWYIIPTIKKFFSLCKDNSYSHEDLEKELGGAVTWFLINIFCHENMINYGTSPRYGWLEEKGKLLKEFVDCKTDKELYELTSVDEEYEHCYKDRCNCELKKCDNPLFKK